MKYRVQVLAVFFLLCSVADGAQIKALIIDGRNNHQWKLTTPVLKKALEDTGLFTVDVATAEPGEEGIKNYRPKFSAYQVVIDNYTDYPKNEPWPAETQAAFVDYVRNGGGLVLIHAAASAFGGWKEFEEMVGLAGWGGRDEKTGPYVRFRDGQFVHDTQPGKAGHHGKQHAFQVTIRNPKHPITRGLPPVWMHTTDEFYDSLRGPANNLEVLATGYSDTAQGGTGENEPVLFTVRYGKGRVFQNVLGHGPENMKCVGFLVTYQRGAEWAATGRVTLKVPADFPTADKPSVRQ